MAEDFADRLALVRLAGTMAVGPAQDLHGLPLIHTDDGRHRLPAQVLADELEPVLARCELARRVAEASLHLADCEAAYLGADVGLDLGPDFCAEQLGTWDDAVAAYRAAAADAP